MAGDGPPPRVPAMAGGGAETALCERFAAGRRRDLVRLPGTSSEMVTTNMTKRKKKELPSQVFIYLLGREGGLLFLVVMFLPPHSLERRHISFLFSSICFPRELFPCCLSVPRIGSDSSGLGFRHIPTGVLYDLLTPHPHSGPWHLTVSRHLSPGTPVPTWHHIIVNHPFEVLGLIPGAAKVPCQSRGATHVALCAPPVL